MTLDDIIKMGKRHEFVISQDVTLKIDPVHYFGAQLHDYGSPQSEYNRVCLSMTDLEKLRDLLNDLLATTEE